MKGVHASSILDAGRSRLLLVDVQQHLASAMHDPEVLLQNCSILLSAARELSVPLTISEQYPKALGRTVPILAEATTVKPIEKLEFSCLRNPAIRSELGKPRDCDLVIAGIEAHVCVLQTALDALNAGYTVFVVADAVTSRNPESKERALRRLGSAGCIVVTTEMVVFEWLGTAAAPQFRSLSKLIR